MAFFAHRLAAAAAAAALSVLTLPALAQPAASAPTAASPGAATAPAPGYAMHHGQHMRHAPDMARMQERRAQHLAAFKDKLQITAAQEGAWNTFTEAMQPGRRHARLDAQDMAQLTTPERIDRMRALRAQRNAEADRRGDATKALYAALTPAQQKTFDEHAHRMQRQYGARAGQGGHPGHRHDHHDHHHYGAGASGDGQRGDRPGPGRAAP